MKGNAYGWMGIVSMSWNRFLGTLAEGGKKALRHVIHTGLLGRLLPFCLFSRTMVASRGEVQRVSFGVQSPKLERWRTEAQHHAQEHGEAASHCKGYPSRFKWIR